MLDVTEQLRRYADVVATTVDAVQAADVGSVATAPSRPPQRPRWQPLLAAAALVALVAGGFWILRATGSTPPADPSPSSNTTSSTRPTVETGDVKGIELLDPGPLAPRAGAAIAWTGDELVAWGGAIEPANMGFSGPDRQFADGAAYNPDTRRWRPISQGPLPASSAATSAVATEAGVVFTRGANTALWEPKADTWRKLDDAPAAVTDLISAGSHAFSASANAELDVDSGQWRSLPEPPEALGRSVAAWNGSLLVVVGQRGNGGAAAIGFDPANESWSQLADPPNLDATALSAARNGDGAVFVDHKMHVAAWQGEKWKRLPSIPAQSSDYTPTLLALQPGLVVTTAQAVAYTNGVSPWIPVPRGELEFSAPSTAVVPGSAIHRGTSSYFEFGVTPSGANRFALVNPELVAAAASTLQIGVMTLRVPDDMTLVASDSTGTTEAKTVRVELRTRTGTCQVASTDDGGSGGDAHPWSAYASGLTWTGRATSSDAVKVVCQDPATAKTVVDATTFP